MPQRQLPIFPAGVTEINSSIAVQKEKEQVWYIHGHLPVFHHHEEDVRSFRMFTSQMIVNGTVKPKEIVKAFGVPSITVKRYVKVFREQGVKGFYETKSRESSASVLKGEVLERARALLEQGRSVPDVSSELKVLANTLHKGDPRVAFACPSKKNGLGSTTVVPTKSERSQSDSEAPMGYGTIRTLERIAAAMGLLASAPIEFQTACDVTQGGVLLALPALLAQGLLRYSPQMYQLPNGFYGIDSIFLLLGFMALARIRSLEHLRYEPPGEWGKLLGLDRIPEVRTLRAKLKLLCLDLGRAMRWNAQLAKEWIARQKDTDLYFYCDGHVRVYHGELTTLPRHYAARERLCLRATTDYWVNAMDGQPFLYVNKEVDPGLIATLKQDVIPWLEGSVPKTLEQEKRLAEDPRAHWFTIVFDREGYSPDFFEQMLRKRIAVLTYHKFPKQDWSAAEFTSHSVQLAGGETVTMKLAERGTQLSNKLWVREIRKLTTHHIPVKSLPEQDRFTRLRTERKHFVDTIKMIGYRAETSLASLLLEHLVRSDDARALLRQIFNNEVDLVPNSAASTLTVRLHHLAQAAHDQALAQLCATLNETETIFPGTNLTLIFEIGSSGIPPDQEV